MLIIIALGQEVKIIFMMMIVISVK